MENKYIKYTLLTLTWFFVVVGVYSLGYRYLYALMHNHDLAHIGGVIALAIVGTTLHFYTDYVRGVQNEKDFRR